MNELFKEGFEKTANSIGKKIGRGVGGIFGKPLLGRPKINDAFTGSIKRQRDMVNKVRKQRMNVAKDMAKARIGTQAKLTRVKGIVNRR